MTIHAIDTHAHLYFEKFDNDRDAVIERARTRGFLHVLNIGIDVDTSKKCIELTKRYPGFCFAAVGLHPNEASVDPTELERIVAELEMLTVQNETVVRAIGEIGLDNYWDRATPVEQERAFIAQIELARRTERPIVIHCREAWQRTLEMISAEAQGLIGVFHCFGGTPEEARRAVDLGWYVSFAGNVSYPKAQSLRDAACEVPLERMLLETDSPFLAPQPVRGKRNEPVFSLHTAETLAEVTGVSFDQVLATTTANAQHLFSLPSLP